MEKARGFEDGPKVAQRLMRATWGGKYVVGITLAQVRSGSYGRTMVNEPNPSMLLALLCDLQVSGAGLSKEGQHLLEIEPPSGTIYIGNFVMDVNG